MLGGKGSNFLLQELRNHDGGKVEPATHAMPSGVLQEVPQCGLVFHIVQLSTETTMPRISPA